MDTQIGTEDILTEMVRKEMEWGRLKKALCDSLRSRIEENTLPGVTPKKGDVRCATASLAAIRNSRAFNLSAEYYIQESQAEAVTTKLDGCKTSISLISAVKDMLADGKVKTGRDSSSTVYLNDATLQCIRESEIGRYVEALNDFERTEALYAAYGDAYEELYEAGSSYPDYEKLVERGDDLLGDETNQSILKAFALIRQDFISSDREAAALALAWNRAFEQQEE